MKRIFLVLMFLSSICLGDEFLSKELNLEGITNVKIEATTIAISYADGIKRIPILELPESVQKYLKIDMKSVEDTLEKNRILNNEAKVRKELLARSVVKSFEVYNNSSDGLIVYELKRVHDTFDTVGVDGRTYTHNRWVYEPDLKFQIFIPHTKETSQLTNGYRFTCKSVKNGVYDYHDSKIESYKIVDSISQFKK